jgi:hypothetical protein
MLTSDNIGGKLDKKDGPAPSGESFRTKFDKKEAPAPRGDNFRIKPSTIWTRDLSLAVAQLRAAHARLALGAVTDQKEFADELISPQIERIEKILRRLA